MIFKTLGLEKLAPEKCMLYNLCLRHNMRCFLSICAVTSRATPPECGRSQNIIKLGAPFYCAVIGFTMLVLMAHFVSCATVLTVTIPIPIFKTTSQYILISLISIFAQNRSLKFVQIFAQIVFIFLEILHLAVTIIALPENTCPGNASTVKLNAT